MLELLMGLLQIIFVNIVLSGDNAVVIALACRNLSLKQRKPAILIGTAGAVVFRIILTIAAVYILKIPFLQFVGGLLLIWISIKLLIQEDEGEDIKSHSQLVDAIKTVIIADLIMSLDNTLAIAAVAKGNIILLSLGLALSIPLVIFGAQIIVMIMEKFPIIVYVGAGLIAWTAGELIKGDEQMSHYIPQIIVLWIPVTITILVVGGSFVFNRLKFRTAKDVLIADEHAAELLDEKISDFEYSNEGKKINERSSTP